MTFLISLEMRWLKIKEVAECHMVAGGFRLFTQVADLLTWRHIVKCLGIIVELPAVSQTHTYVVMEQVKEDHRRAIVLDV